MTTIIMERVSGLPARDCRKPGLAARSAKSSAAMPQTIQPSRGETDIERLRRVAEEADSGQVWRATGMDRATLHERLFGR